MVYHWSKISSLKRYASGEVIVVADDFDAAVDAACKQFRQRQENYYFSFLEQEEQEEIIDESVAKFRKELEDHKKLTIDGGKNAVFLILGSE